MLKCDFLIQNIFMFKSSICNVPGTLNLSWKRWDQGSDPMLAKLPSLLDIVVALWVGTVTVAKWKAQCLWEE